MSTALALVSAVPESAAQEPPRGASSSSASSSLDSKALSRWLILGPWPVPLPAGDDVEASILLGGGSAPVDAPPFGDAWPAAGDTVVRADGESIAWRAVDGGLTVDEPASPHRALLALYLDASRYTTPELVVRSRHPLRILLDGEEIERQAKSSPPPAEAPRRARRRRAAQSTDTGIRSSAELKLAPGKHLLWLDTVYDPAAGGDWAIDAKLVGDGTGDVAVDLEPVRGLDLDDLLESPAITDLRLAPDGRHVALSLARPSVPASQRDRWVAIYDTSSGEEIASLWGSSGIVWSPDGRFYSYTTPGHESDTTDLWRQPVGEKRLADGPAEPIVRGVANLEGHRWTPDSASILLEIKKAAENDDRGAKRYRDLADRWSDRRDLRSLYRVAAAGGPLQPLTLGNPDQALLDVRPDSGALLVSRVDHSITERPFSRTELLELDLSTLTTRTVASLGWFGDASYSPDGRRLLITGGPSIFERAGTRLPDDVVPNDYDTQAYILDLETGAVDAFTAEIDPSVLQAHWSRHDDRIYLRIQDGSRSGLAAFNPRDRSLTRYDLATETVGHADIAPETGLIAYLGASPDQSHTVYVLPTDSAAPESREIVRPAAERLEHARLAEVRDWSFTSSDGDTIQGRYYLPPDFDPSRRYPLIVDYYGGTVPVSRGFGGRYPKAYWAARGYVVLVVQPSGATGYGQEFSARHVDAWGRRTADEIIEGTETFLAEHAFVDSERVGCIGASYGGFMTMYLVSRTDLFAAAVSHAGISNLASYWGAGWWGYLYSAVASADSYPWNDRELYVDQSPLFAADQIETPLLLLHGDADTNVPPVESQQMYTALRLLGREVELIEIEGEDHWILDYPKRRLWAQTIVAWFDKQLKDEAGWWESLWGTDDEPRG